MTSTMSMYLYTATQLYSTIPAASPLEHVSTVQQFQQDYISVLHYIALQYNKCSGNTLEPCSTIHTCNRTTIHNTCRTRLGQSSTVQYVQYKSLKFQFGCRQSEIFNLVTGSRRELMLATMHIASKSKIYGPALKRKVNKS